MQLDSQDFLRLTEKANTLAFVDLEATGLRGDYNSVLVVSVLRFNDRQPTFFAVEQPGNDKKVVREAKEMLEECDAWVTYYGKGFDIPMLNTRLLRWELRPIDKRPHIDLYFTLKYNILTARRSMAHLSRWLETAQKKKDMNPDVWASIVGNLKKYMPEMIERCNSDTKETRDLYCKVKHLIREIKR